MFNTVGEEVCNKSGHKEEDMKEQHRLAHMVEHVGQIVEQQD